MQLDVRRHVRHNFLVNVTDGGFFGLGLGFSSYVTIIPLFIALLTESTLLIGLASSLHLAFWQLPQLLLANRVSRMLRYKPLVILLTLLERFPFFGLAFTALLLPTIGREWALVLALLFIAMQSLGAGLTATPWQSMIAKIIPSDHRGTFYGMQSALANLLQSGAAVMAGVILTAVAAPLNFAVCFTICGLFMMVSFVMLALTREPVSQREAPPRANLRDFATRLRVILKRDHNFRWFIVGRLLLQVAMTGSAFFIIYAVRRFNMDAGMAGILTGFYMLATCAANIGMGWLGDRLGHRFMFVLGMAGATGSVLLALAAPSLEWFYVIFALTAFAGTAVWTTSMAMTADFAHEEDLPYYAGLGNTLVAPATLFAPVIAGWVVDGFSFGAAFALMGICGLIGLVIALFALRDPQPMPFSVAMTAAAAGD